MTTTLKTIVLISLGLATAQAFAGPDWDVINRARAAARHPVASSTRASATSEAMLARCNEMMKQMGSQPAGSSSPKGAADTK